MANIQFDDVVVISGCGPVGMLDVSLLNTKKCKKLLMIYKNVPGTRETLNPKYKLLKMFYLKKAFYGNATNPLNY